MLVVEKFSCHLKKEKKKSLANMVTFLCLKKKRTRNLTVPIFF